MHGWIEGLNMVSAIWADAMGRVLWQGGLALLIAGLVCRLAPRIPAHVQCWLWRLAYAKLFFAMVGLAPVELPLLPPNVSAAVEIPHSGPLPASLASFGSPAPSAPAATDGWPEPVATTPAIGVLGWLILGWFAVLGCWALRVRRQFRETHVVRKTGVPVDDSRILDQVSELSVHLGLRHSPEVLKTPATPGPVLIGVLRPAVVLPESLVSGGDPEEVRLVLAHELGHLKRRDLPWTWLPTLAQGFFPFHPLIWWAQREWAVAVETACDELVLRETAAPPARYARMLLDTATRFGGDTQLRLTTVGVVGSCRSLRRRLQMMHHIRPLSRRGQRLTTAALAVIGTVTLVPWRVVASPAAPATAPAETPVEVRAVKRARAAGKPIAESQPPATPARSVRPVPAVVAPPPVSAAVPTPRATVPAPPKSVRSRSVPVVPAAPANPFSVTPPAAPIPGEELPVPAREVNPTQVLPPLGVPGPVEARRPAQVHKEVRPLPANPVGPGREPAAAAPGETSEPGVPFLKDLPYIGRLFRTTPTPPAAAADPAMPQGNGYGRPTGPARAGSASEPRAGTPSRRPADPNAARLDDSGNSRVEVMVLRHIYVTDLQHLLQAGSGLPQGIRQLSSDERANSLIVQGSETSLERVKAAIRLVDVPMQIERGRFRIRLKPANARLEQIRLQVLALPGAQEAEQEADALVLRGSNLWVREAMAVAARLEMGLSAGRVRSRGTLYNWFDDSAEGAARPNQPNYYQYMKNRLQNRQPNNDSGRGDPNREQRDNSLSPARPIPGAEPEGGRPSAAPAAPRVENVTQVIRLQFIGAEDLQQQLKEGNEVPAWIEEIISDSRTNSLIVRGTEAAIERLKAVIRRADKLTGEPPKAKE